MSKTIGNVVLPLEYVEEFGADALRYYLLAEVPTTEDGDFTREKFLARYNGDLANGLGNLTARILTLVDGREFANDAGELESAFRQAWEEYHSAFGGLNLRGAVEAAWRLIHVIDEFIDRKKPWESKDSSTLATLTTGLANVAFLVRPFLPGTSDKIFAGLGVSPDDKNWAFKPKKIEPLFPRF
jgi:methionyl-tRNA synthetase